MGQFIGGAGAAFIMAAAAAVIVKFLMEINVIKDIDRIKIYGRISVMTFVIGVVYVFVAVFMFNVLHGRTNFFDFDRIFAFLDINTVMNNCKNPNINQMFSGFLMPLYPLLVNIIGKLLFEQYVLVAEFISFVSACISACIAYSILQQKFSREKASDIMFFIASFPYIFMLFTPTYMSITMAFILCGVQALLKGRYKYFVVMLILSCLSSKLGLLMLLYFVIWKTGKFLPVKNKLQKSIVLNNERLKTIVISLLVLFNGAIIFCLIGGIV